MSAPEFLYKQSNLEGYYNGILTDRDGRTVEYYENVMDPGGNSYYRENPEYSNAVDTLYPEEYKKTVDGITLDSVVKLREFRYPDLIKIDVQGAELDILKGAETCLEHAKHIIVELQKVEYNKGAPRREEVIEYLKSKNFHLVGNGPFHDAGPDGDYHFKKFLEN
jgi:FkbM family methyltransferase